MRNSVYWGAYKFALPACKFSMESVNLCKCTARCPDLLADKPHPRFLRKILSEKVRLIRRCLRLVEVTPLTCFDGNVSHSCIYKEVVSFNGLNGGQWTYCNFERLRLDTNFKWIPIIYEKRVHFSFNIRATSEYKYLNSTP